MTVWTEVSIPFTDAWDGGFRLYFDGRFEDSLGVDPLPVVDLPNEKSQTRRFAISVSDETEFALFSVENDSAINVSEIEIVSPNGVSVKGKDLLEHDGIEVLDELSVFNRLVLAIKNPMLGQWRLNITIFEVYFICKSQLISNDINYFRPGKERKTVQRFY